MSSGRNSSRVGLALGAIFAGVVLTACADKAFRPPVNASPKIQLQFNTVGAQQVSAAGKKQVLVVVAAYQSSVVNAQTDSFRILAEQVVQVTGASQDVTLNVDLTGCLADGTRKGSQTGCSIYYGVWLHDSAGFSADSGDFTKYAYDYTFLGPIDISPGKAPVLPAITLSQSRFSVFQFVGDEALRLGGPQTPNSFSGSGFSGTVSGQAAGSPPILFGITQGFQQTSTCSGGQNNCTPSGYSAAQLAIFQNGAWTRVSAPPGILQFNDVTAFAVNDVWLAGQGGIYHYDGSGITQVSGTSGENVVSIGGIVSGGVRYVVAGTSAGNAWFGNTTTFTKSSVSITGGGIDAACVTGPTEAFAMNSASGSLYRFNGSSWISVPAGITGAKTDLQCPSAGQAFVSVLTTGLQGIISWNGSSFGVIPSPPKSGRLAVISNSEMYVAADSGNTNRNFYRYNGSSWQLVYTSHFVQAQTFRPYADPRGGAAYFPTAFGRVDRATPTGAHPVSYNPSLRDAIMTSATSAFAVGWNMFLARWNGATWTVDQPPAGTVSIRILNGVWSDGPSNAWVVGGSATILHYDGSNWSVVSDAIHPTASLDGYTAVWGSGGSVWIAGGNSIVRCRSVSSCTPDPVTGIDSLFSIWGTSTTNAWAVGAHGKILHFDGTQWTSVTSPTSHRMVRLWGSGASDVWAVGDSVVAHYDGTAWTNFIAGDLANNGNTGGVPSQQSGGTNPFQIGMWGAGARDVYAGSYYGNVYRYDGSGLNPWNSVQTPNSNNGSGRIVAIAGYTGGCAFALVDELSAGYGATLLRGVGPTGCFGAPMSTTLPWP
jgi:hypothetical protein